MKAIWHEDVAEIRSAKLQSCSKADAKAVILHHASLISLPEEQPWTYAGGVEVG